MFLFFMVKLLLSVYFQLLHCRLISYHATGTFRMATKYTGKLHLLVVKNWFSGYLAVRKIRSDGPSYRVGETSRARLKGSLASPTSIPRKGTSFF